MSPKRLETFPISSKFMGALIGGSKNMKKVVEMIKGERCGTFTIKLLLDRLQSSFMNGKNNRNNFKEYKEHS